MSAATSMGISRAQALNCLQSVDLIGLGMEADAVRRSLHPEEIVSYCVDVAVSANEDDFDRIHSFGANSVRMSEAPGAWVNLQQLQSTVRAVLKRFPAVRVHGPAGSIILELADRAGVRISEAVARLASVGLSGFATDDFATAESERLFELHRYAHRGGINTAAGMIFGAGESLQQRVEHLFAIRQLQEETGGFTSFTPSSFRPDAGSKIDAPTAVEYMRTLAVSRMVLDNIENLEANCLANGLKVVQMALRFGANDGGAIRAEGDMTFTEEDLRRVVRDAGFTPMERDTLYRTMFPGN